MGHTPDRVLIKALNQNKSTIYEHDYINTSNSDYVKIRNTPFIYLFYFRFSLEPKPQTGK